MTQVWFSQEIFATTVKSSILVNQQNTMEELEKEKILRAFGKRAQRCYGCFVAFHFKDMYLGEDASYYCEHCKSDGMFHFDDFVKLIDVSKLRESKGTHHLD